MATKSSGRASRICIGTTLGKSTLKPEEMTRRARLGLVVVAAEPLIRVDGLTKHYPGVIALDDLSLDFPRGLIGLVGANGAGKTTMFRLLLGISKPTEGSIEV